MRVLVIGGTGNISTAIVHELLARGDDVTLYTRGHNSIPAGCRSLVGDRTQHAIFEAQMADAGPFDAVIDMVGYAAEDANSAVRAFRGRVEQYLFCSTVDVYTKPAACYPVNEDAPRHPSPAFQYAYQKALCENILLDAHARGDVPVTLLRPAATYNESWSPVSLLGPGSTLLRRIQQGQPVIVLGDGSSLWSSCHRDDVARAFVAALGNPATLGQAYNLSGDEWITWEAYYQTVASVLQAPAISFIRIPTRVLARMAPRDAEGCMENFQYHSVYNNFAAKATLGFQYTVYWEAGVQAMVAWHEARGLLADVPAYPLYDAIIAEWQQLEQTFSLRHE